MSKQPVLILIHGMPGAGKTTLLRKVTTDLGLPGIGKDDIKELLFAHLGIGDLQWSNDLGAATAEMVFSLIDTWVGRGRSLIVESAFYKELAAERIAKTVASGVTCIELYCKVDLAVRSQRIAARIANGTRHPGHIDNIVNTTDAAIQARYAPLGVGTLIEIDTTDFGDKEYAELLKKVKALL